VQAKKRDGEIDPLRPSREHDRRPEASSHSQGEAQPGFLDGDWQRD